MVVLCFAGLWLIGDAWCPVMVRCDEILNATGMNGEQHGS